MNPIAYASAAARFEEPEDEECTCGDGLDFCPLHDDEEDAIDWERDAEDRAERRAER